MECPHRRSSTRSLYQCSLRPGNRVHERIPIERIHLVEYDIRDYEAVAHSGVAIRPRIPTTRLTSPGRGLSRSGSTAVPRTKLRNNGIGRCGAVPSTHCYGPILKRCSGKRSVCSEAWYAVRCMVHSMYLLPNVWV